MNQYHHDKHIANSGFFDTDVYGDSLLLQSGSINSDIHNTNTTTNTNNNTNNSTNNSTNANSSTNNTNDTHKNDFLLLQGAGALPGAGVADMHGVQQAHARQAPYSTVQYSTVQYSIV